MPSTSRDPRRVQLAEILIAPAIADLAQRLDVDADDIDVVQALPVIWNDGSVGCPEPDRAYTQAIVPGMWVLLGHGGHNYSYHAAGIRGFRLCEAADVGPHAAPPHGRINDEV